MRPDVSIRCLTPTESDERKFTLYQFHIYPTLNSFSNGVYFSFFAFRFAFAATPNAGFYIFSFSGDRPLGEAGTWELASSWDTMLGPGSVPAGREPPARGPLKPDARPYIRLRARACVAAHP